MNSTEIFGIALGLSIPWYVERVEFSDSNCSKELHLYLNFERGYKFPTSTSSSSAYDTVDRVSRLLERLKEIDEESPNLGLRAFVWNIEHFH